MLCMDQDAHEGQVCQDDRLVSASEIAGVLGVSRSTVVRLGKRGELVPVRLSARCTRYRLGDVNALVRRRSDRMLSPGRE